MKARITIYALLIIAYTVSLAHSFIPHHHHKSAEEISLHDKEHEREHHNEHGHSHAHSNTDDHSSSGSNGDADKHKHAEHGLAHVFFLSHDFGAEVNVRSDAFSKLTKTKSVNNSFCQDVAFEPIEILKAQIFDPPQNEKSNSSPALSSGLLRAPPTRA